MPAAAVPPAGSAAGGPSPIPATPAAPGEDAPIVVHADRIQGHRNQEVEASGNVLLQKDKETLSADQLTYYQPQNEVVAQGNVRLEQAGNVATGPDLKLNLGTNIGQMSTPHFEILSTHARGDGSKLLFEGKDQYRLEDARYTTCPVGQDDWFLHVVDLQLDRTTQIGTARNAYIEFKGVPLLYTPWITFPLNNQRKTGLLTPSFGSSGNSGAEFTVPFYWNIAPNYDATFTPRFLAKRGLQIGAEFRYLQPSYFGTFQGEVLPNDKVAGMNRYAITLQHQQTFSPAWSGYLNVQKVSDDNYFRDLSTQLSNVTQVNLPREGALIYNGGWWNFTTRVQKWQTLQDPQAPIVPPYDRAPQLLLNAERQDILGTDITMMGEYVDFQHPTLATGKRFIAYPTISLPLSTASAYVTPKIGVNYARYTLDPNTTTLPDTTRTVPIFSVDSGVYFDRDVEIGGQRMEQTLEPRLYYVYIPYRDQSQIPVFDTAVADFNFAQIFTENQYTGWDRINDANQVTAALTTRFINPNTGVERLRAAVGQIYYFRTPQVTLPGQVPQTARTSDVLAAVGGQLTQDWYLDTGWQYNPHDRQTEKFSFNARYRPEAGKLVNLGYRLTRGVLKQVDVSTQWPITSRWSGLARWNYSILDSKVLESLAGLEYNGGCWALRGVVHHLTTSTAQSSNAILIQLELNGVSRLGANPLDLLRQNIPGYVKTNEPQPQ